MRWTPSFESQRTGRLLQARDGSVTYRQNPAGLGNRPGPARSCEARGFPPSRLYLGATRTQATLPVSIATNNVAYSVGRSDLSHVRAKTEILLHYLEFAGLQLLGGRSTIRVIGGLSTDFYGDNWERQLQRLREKALLEVSPGGPRDRVWKLSERGRVLALGGRDPTVEWARRWDGMWRFVLFDLPSDRQKDRVALRRLLRRHGWGCLQLSGWISPHPLPAIAALNLGERFASSLLLLDARPAAGETDAEIVQAAWDFEAINAAYAEFLGVLKHRPKADSGAASHGAWVAWWRAVHEAWRNAVQRDPLLPSALLPSGYRGRGAWEARNQTLAACAAKCTPPVVRSLP